MFKKTGGKAGSGKSRRGEMESKPKRSAKMNTQERGSEGKKEI